MWLDRLHEPQRTYSLQILVGATTPVVDLAALKLHLLIEHDLDNDWLRAMEQAATRLAESYTGRRFGLQTWRIELDHWPVGPSYRSAAIELPGIPAVEVLSLSMLDSAGVSTPVEGYGCWLTHNPPLVLPPTDGWPELSEGSRVRVDYTCGQSPAPSPVIAAVQLTVGHLYRHRGDGKPVEEKLPPAAMALLDSAWVGRYV